MTEACLFEPAFLYRISPEMERRLGSRLNRRSFTGIGRKWNAGWMGPQLAFFTAGSAR